jgi:threonine/homoserine/homoserine lactone efflux protein
MTASLLAFVPVALLLAIIPGADTALVTKNALTLGLRGARWTILGICVGCLVHATASALGLSAILSTSARAYETVKLAGAAYLVWIGVQSIRGATAPADTAPDTAPTPPPTTVRGAHPWAQGFLTNVLNPKVALFYLTFLPQFIPAGAPVLRTSLLLAMIHIVIGFAWLSLYARFVDRLRGALTRPMVKAWLERVTGGALVLLGARLAWERR